MSVQTFGRLVARRVVTSTPRELHAQIAEKDWADIRADEVYASLFADLGRLARGYELDDIAYREGDIDIILNSLYEAAGQNSQGLSPQESHLKQLAQMVIGELDCGIPASVIPLQRLATS